MKNTDTVSLRKKLEELRAPSSLIAKCDSYKEGFEQCRQMAVSAATEAAPVAAIQPAGEAERKNSSYIAPDWDLYNGGLEEAAEIAEGLEQHCIANEIRALKYTTPAASAPAQPTTDANEICQVPPEGWYCTRKAGHDGPCAAHPHEADRELDADDYACIAKGMERLNSSKPEPAQPEAKGEAPKSFWVVEQFTDGCSTGYWDGGSSRSFTADIDKAVHFCRHTDGFWATRGWHWGDTKLTEHIMLDIAAPVPAAPADKGELQNLLELATEFGSDNGSRIRFSNDDFRLYLERVLADHARQAAIAPLGWAIADEQARFEQWSAETWNYKLKPANEGSADTYMEGETETAWMGWKARASIARPVAAAPQPPSTGSIADDGQFNTLASDHGRAIAREDSKGTTKAWEALVAHIDTRTAALIDAASKERGGDAS